jgi:hypothetical protein
MMTGVMSVKDTSSSTHPALCAFSLVHERPGSKRAGVIIGSQVFSQTLTAMAA